MRDTIGVYTAQQVPGNDKVPRIVVGRCCVGKQSFDSAPWQGAGAEIARAIEVAGV